MLLLGTFPLSQTVPSFYCVIFLSLNLGWSVHHSCSRYLFFSPYICMFFFFFCINCVSFSFHLTFFCYLSLTCFHFLTFPASNYFSLSLCCFDSDAVIRLSILILSCQCSSVHSELQLPPPPLYRYPSPSLFLSPSLSLHLPSLPSLSLSDNRNADGMSKQRLTL